MIKIREGQSKFSYHYIPQEWKEVTFAGFWAYWQRREDNLPEPEMLALISGVDLSVITQTAEVWDGRINWKSMGDGINDMLSQKGGFKTCEINVYGKTGVRIPTFASCMLAQRMFMQNLFKEKKDGDSIIECMAGAVAIAIAPKVAGHDWAEQLKEIESDVWQLPAWQVYQNGSFFLSSSMITNGNGLLSISRLMAYGSRLVRDRLKATGFLTTSKA